jgi:hypothetical protein
MKAFVTGADYIVLPVLMLQIVSPTFQQEEIPPFYLTFNYLNGDIGLATISVVAVPQGQTDGVAATPTRLYTPATSGTISIPVAFPGGSIAPGTYTLLLTMLYDNGDEATTSVTIDIVPLSADVPVPAISFTQSGSTLIVAVSATDIVGLASAKLTLDGADIQDWVIT